MSLASLLTQRFTLKHAVDGDRDDYGNPARTYPDTGDQVLGYFEPQTETEQLVEAETYRTTYRLFLAAAADITVHDQVADDSGTAYEVIEVLHFYNPRTRELAHIECRCEQVEG